MKLMMTTINVPDFENDSCAENVSDDEWGSAPSTSLRGKRKASSESVNISPVPVRIMGGRRGGDSRIEPRYLEAMSLLMAENLSATEAIKAVHIVDTIVWGQTRHLPLRLEKEYQHVLCMYKKLQTQKSLNHDTDNFSPSIDSMDDVEYLISDEISNEVKIQSHSNHGSEQPITPEDISVINDLKVIIDKHTDIRKDDTKNTLPYTKCLRSNHNLLSNYYCEGQVTNELLEKTGFILPNGTSRQGVGDIASAVVKVGGWIRALKGLQIGKGDRANWASAINHMVDRLSSASNKEIRNIWESITAMVSDLCKVNLGLANEVKKLIGTEWLPGQGFCNLHYTLAIPVGIKEVLALYQSHIGADKLFPHNVSFEMEIEDTSIRWQARPWNRYVSFTEYAEKRGFRNVGHMLHANRFNEFEERCGGGVYLADVWISWLDTFSDVRN